MDDQSYAIIKKLHERGKGDFLVSGEERRPHSCSNGSPNRRSSSDSTSEQLAPIVSVDEYRVLMRDTKSTDEQITQRMQYLDSLFRTIIRNELKTYDKTKVAPTRNNS